MTNVAVLVADSHLQDDDLLGLYKGVALTERDSDYTRELPDTITIYREELLDGYDSDEEIGDQVKGSTKSPTTSAAMTINYTNWAGSFHSATSMARSCLSPVL